MVHGRLWVGCITACLCLMASAQDGTYYKWTDAHGTVHFSATPPAGRKAQPIKVEGESKGKATPAAEPLPPSEPTPELRQAQADYRRRSCTAARSDLKLLAQDRMVVNGDDPDAATKLDREQRGQARLRAQQRISQFCEGGKP